MTCRCRDLEKKRCRWEHPSDTWTKHLKRLTKVERKRTRIATRRLTPSSDE